ncbi:transposable element Tcb2 transposase [Trichonephila clavipes]|nr:transposable element Tcb2 transposase [Trichonephila clavipes]
MDWSADSPDLNPIEHVWDMLGRRIAARQPPPTCLPELWRALLDEWTSTAGSDVVQSGRPIFDDFFQHLWPYIGNNTANVVFQMVKRLWLIRIDQ